jgi:hypothetical protein
LDRQGTERKYNLAVHETNSSEPSERSLIPAVLLRYSILDRRAKRNMKLRA